MGPITTPRELCALLGVVAGAGLAASSARATVEQTVAGISSAGVAYEFSARFTISGDTLTIVLCNDSSVHSQNPNDLLSSFYFDIVDAGNNRPTLVYAGATGDVWLATSAAPDTLQTAAADIKADAAGDNSWQFKTFDPGISPFLGYGLGTVGNSNITPSNFNGNIVGGRDFSIYAGDVTTANLNNTLLVKDCATFVLTGVSGFLESHIRPNSAFGLGTAPDSVHHAPAPAGALLLAAGGGLTLRRRRR